MSFTTAEQEKKMPFEIRTHKKWENPKVSVIVPVYKVDRYLTQCLNSIVNQTMEELEIIIVDEGDYDRCREIIDFFAANDPRIVAPHQKNGGYAASCNLGLSMARGEYLAFVESDDWIEPEMYEEMYAYAKALDADVVKTPYYEAFSDGRRYDCPGRKIIRERTPQNMCFSLKDFGEILAQHPSVWSALYKTEYMNRERIRYVEQRGSYVDVAFRISIMKTDKLAWLDKPYYYWRVDSEGSSNSIWKIDQMIDRWEEFLALFNDRKETFKKSYAEHLILEVWRNIIDSPRFHKSHLTDAACMKIGKILQYFPEESILESDEIDERIKKELILFRKEPSLIKGIVEHHSERVATLQRVELALEKLTNPTLLFFAFVGFVTFGGIEYYLLASGIELPFVLMLSLNVITLACIAVISLSFAAKLMRKCMKIAKRFYKGKTK